jgi:hypothetical protein
VWAESFGTLQQMVKEHQASHLSVSNDVHASRFLHCNCLVNGTVLNPFELRRRQLTRHPLLARLLEILRS